MQVYGPEGGCSVDNSRLIRTCSNRREPQDSFQVAQLSSFCSTATLTVRICDESQIGTKGYLFLWVEMHEYPAQDVSERRSTPKIGFQQIGELCYCIAIASRHHTLSTVRHVSGFIIMPSFREKSFLHLHRVIPMESTRSLNKVGKSRDHATAIG
jgi:hypothetical protein